MRGDSHVQFSGGREVVILPCYPADGVQQELAEARAGENLTIEAKSKIDANADQAIR
jgi:hypothetical protein